MCGPAVSCKARISSSLQDEPSPAWRRRVDVSLSGDNRLTYLNGRLSSFRRRDGLQLTSEPPPATPFLVTLLKKQRPDRRLAACYTSPVCHGEHHWSVAPESQALVSPASLLNHPCKVLVGAVTYQPRRP